MRKERAPTWWKQGLVQERKKEEGRKRRMPVSTQALHCHQIERTKALDLILLVLMMAAAYC
jgi:hypothetical protein